MSLKIIANNRKARYDYSVLDTYEAGIVLKGSEVKSLREGKVTLKESFALLEEEEVYLHNCHINPYSHDTSLNYDPLRKRKLLFHKKEIKKITIKIVEKNLSLIPLKMYFKNGKVKVEIGIAKGKKLYDKRDVIKKRDTMRDVDKALRYSNRGQ